MRTNLILAKILLYSIVSLVVLSIFSYSPDDFSLNTVSESINNYCGYVGAMIADGLLQVIGYAVFMPLVFLLFWSYINFDDYKIGYKAFALLFAIILADFCFTSVDNFFINSGVSINLGGLLGIFCFNIISSYVGSFIAYLFIPALCLAIYLLAYCCEKQDYLIVFANFSIIKIKKVFLVLMKNIEQFLRFLLIKLFFTLASFVAVKFKNIICILGSKILIYFKTKKSNTVFQSKVEQKVEKTKQIIQQNKSEIINLPLNLLNRYKDKFKFDNHALKINATNLVAVLKDFGIDGDIVNIRPGPVVILYEFKPAPGVKVSKVISLANDVARSMAVSSTRIFNIPDSAVIGIELPNDKREPIGLKNMLYDLLDNSYGQLVIALGLNTEGQSMYADLSNMPHLLVAGTTGSGKSVSLNAMICSLLYQYQPSECRFLMIDPKMLELSVYDNIPHLVSPVITDPQKAINSLKWLVRIMEKRYVVMNEMKVRNINSYNDKINKLITNKKLIKASQNVNFNECDNSDQLVEPEIMPFIVLVVDEMADLMLVAGKEIENYIQRLAQMARAAGIHMIMATQRPSVDVITGTIKANFPARISFRVSSKIDSRTILNEQGAEQLLGCGDMLYAPYPGNVIRVHGPFISDQEVENITNFLRRNYIVNYFVDDFQDDCANDEICDDDKDSLFDKAVEFIMQEQKVSISFVQRGLKIGYNRAANIVEMMEKQGIVSSADHVGRRKILIG